MIPTPSAGLRLPPHCAESLAAPLHSDLHRDSSTPPPQHRSSLPEPSCLCLPSAAPPSRPFGTSALTSTAHRHRLLRTELRRDPVFPSIALRLSPRSPVRHLRHLLWLPPCIPRQQDHRRVLCCKTSEIPFRADSRLIHPIAAESAVVAGPRRRCHTKCHRRPPLLPLLPHLAQHTNSCVRPIVEPSSNNRREGFPLLHGSQSTKIARISEHLPKFDSTDFKA